MKERTRKRGKKEGAFFELSRFMSCVIWQSNLFRFAWLHRWPSQLTRNDSDGDNQCNRFRRV